jgi:hypothetical protein
LPAPVTHSPDTVWWVRVDEQDSLEAAFNRLRNFPAGFPAVRLIPYWNPVAGTRFAVLLDHVFADEQAARRRLSQLPADLAAEPVLQSDWDESTVFFNNPYGDKGDPNEKSKRYVN